MIDDDGTETGRSGVTAKGQRLAGHGEGDHALALEGEHLEARSSARPAGRSAGSGVSSQARRCDGLDEERLVLRPA